MPGGEEDGEAALYRRAVQIVAGSQKASTSYLQRQLRVGYNNAARLIERMEKDGLVGQADRSEEHTSELQSLMRISYAVFCLKKKKKKPYKTDDPNTIQPEYMEPNHRTEYNTQATNTSGNIITNAT